MLFSAYTTMANGDMSSVAFGILFGNKDMKNWMLFCDFMSRKHPTINHPEVTVMTDQDKGSITAVTTCIPKAHNFWKEKVWMRDLLLTPKGMGLMMAAFDPIKLIEFRLLIQEDNTHSSHWVGAQKSHYSSRIRGQDP